MEISDRLTILRKGVKIGTVNSKGISKEKIAEMMVGHQLRGITINPDRPAPGEVVLSCSNVYARNDRDLPALADISLSIRKGEILGIAGVDGNGQEELSEVLSGLRVPDEGHITIDGKDITGSCTRNFIDSGISYIPADRKGVGLIPNMNITENMPLKNYWEPPIETKKYFMDWKYVYKFAEDKVGKYDVVAPSLHAPVRILSGGNLQKLMLSREISDDTKVIIAMQPTWGLDVGAAEFVHQRLMEARDKGVAIMLISKDLQELQSISDRIAVIYNGSIIGIIDDPQTTSTEKIGLMMAGVRTD